MTYLLISGLSTVPLVVACSGSGTPTTITEAPSTSEAPSPATTEKTLQQVSELGPCVPGPPLGGMDRRVEAVVAAYNAWDAERVLSIIGDGPVVDPSLQPGEDTE